jgi:hypothetical protein
MPNWDIPDDAPIGLNSQTQFPSLSIPRLTDRPDLGLRLDGAAALL